INWDGDNVLAIRVYNGGNPGGIVSQGLRISVPSSMSLVEPQFSETMPEGKTMADCTVSITNRAAQTVKANVEITATDIETGNVVAKQSKRGVTLGTKPYKTSLQYDRRQTVNIEVKCRNAKTGSESTSTYIPKYILTPDAPATPRYNGPLVFGVRPGSPIIFRLPFSGERPMRYTVQGLPDGVTCDADKGTLSGKTDVAGDYHLTLIAENAKGRTEQSFTLKVGTTIGLTPPMGWNSWNCWGLSVSQERVLSSAHALIDKGLADYGYSYINIDDAWEAAERNADGSIACNEKFPDIKGLADWLHSEGLKMGIYSSPGDYTCGHYLGSIDHEQQDAQTYNAWGVDYLKYDWCGYGSEFGRYNDHSHAGYIAPYALMGRFLRQLPRDIFYSLCQYGMDEVWKWGEYVDANSWRTTGDITDTWQSLYDIGFNRQPQLHPYAKPGHWNDPDMLIVGKVGWSDNLRDSRLTPDEQYTHISLWSLLAANMLIGCDIAQMDEFTRALLCNHEVNAINQDVLGKQAKRVVNDGDVQIWMRDLADGSKAVGVFNLSDELMTVDCTKYAHQLGIRRMPSQVRDLWRQKDLSEYTTSLTIPPHGVKLLKVCL
ncbi:MAG: alpha-galactosidase, partial [Bacteroidaceae bacterium]|nr:alpha-galactosidase [Bacteroidaceae bacterium]MCF0196713.1 alpha-galactosidase [Bacteroidaceae bacterium]